MNNTPEEFLSAIEVIIDDCEYGKISTGQCLSDIKNCLFVYGKTTQPKISPPVPDDVVINLNRFQRPVRKVPDGHDMDDNQYDLGWNSALKKVEVFYATEVSLKLAWEKRAYQAEKELNNFRADLCPTHAKVDVEDMLAGVIDMLHTGGAEEGTPYEDWARALCGIALDKYQAATTPAATPPESVRDAIEILKHVWVFIGKGEKVVLGADEALETLIKYCQERNAK